MKTENKNQEIAFCLLFLKNFLHNLKKKKKKKILPKRALFVILYDCLCVCVEVEAL